MIKKVADICGFYCSTVFFTASEAKTNFLSDVVNI